MEFRNSKFGIEVGLGESGVQLSRPVPHQMCFLAGETCTCRSLNILCSMGLCTLLDVLSAVDAKNAHGKEWVLVLDVNAACRGTNSKWMCQGNTGVVVCSTLCYILPLAPCQDDELGRLDDSYVFTYN